MFSGMTHDSRIDLGDTNHEKYMPQSYRAEIMVGWFNVYLDDDYVTLKKIKILKKNADIILDSFLYLFKIPSYIVHSQESFCPFKQWRVCHFSTRDSSILFRWKWFLIFLSMYAKHVIWYCPISFVIWKGRNVRGVQQEPLMLLQLTMGIIS